MSATSASHSTDSSYAFLRSPLRRLEKVTWRLVVSSIRRISRRPRRPCFFAAKAAAFPSGAAGASTSMAAAAVVAITMRWSGGGWICMMACRRRTGGCLPPAGLNLVALGICRDAIFGGKTGQFYYLERKGSRNHKWQQLAGWPVANPLLSPPGPWPSFTWLSFLHLQKNLPCISTFVFLHPESDT